MKKLFFLSIIFLLIFLISFTSAYHTFDTKVEKAQSATPATQAYTCGAGTTLLVVSVMATTTGDGTSTAPTYNGVALTPTDTHLGDTAGEGIAEMWYMVNPPTGSAYDVVVTVAGVTGDISYVVSSYKAQAGYTSALDAVNKASSAGAVNPNLTVTTTAIGDVVVDALFDGYTSAPTANRATLLYSRDTGIEDYAAQYNLTGTLGTVMMSYTISSDDYQYVVAAFKEVNLPPTYSKNSTNGTAAGSYVLHSLNWTDPTSLSGYIFEFDNGNGTFYNNTFVTFSGTQNWSNVSKVVNETMGSNIKWRVYSNDSANQWNSTSIFTYTTTSSSPCTYSGSGNWAILFSDYCNITSNVAAGAGTNTITISGIGEFRTIANITGFKNVNFLGTAGQRSLVYCLNGGCFT